MKYKNFKDSSCLVYVLGVWMIGIKKRQPSGLEMRQNTCLAMCICAMCIGYSATKRREEKERGRAETAECRYSFLLSTTDGD